MLNITNSQKLNESQIRQIAPSVYTENAAHGTSEKYTHIPTHRVVNDMELLGWDVIDAKEIKARRNVGFQKHLLVFRNPEIVINGADGDTVYPQFY
jgi:hypothetical protein